MSFDIPAQPLGAALDAYSRITGEDVLYNGALARGRRSAVVEGSYAPAEALAMLLAGTGLSAQFKGGDFFDLVPVPPAGPPAAPADPVPVAVQHYYGLLQASLRTAFCGNGDVAAGGYRVAARLWIGPSGHVEEEERLESTGNAARDREIDDALHGMDLGEPPPAHFAEPVTIVIMPGGPGVSQDCGGGAP